ncbi:MAG TPA: archease [Thermoplasmataceae archaeon]|nr:archease [Thermoplasmatales archaeon AK]HLH85891.1 archease [Thermoplasmataceae archaeon]
MFQVLEHTGDAAVLFSGSTVQEMFQSALMGFDEVIGIPERFLGKSAKASECFDFRSWEDLLVDFFNRMIYLFDTESLIAVKIAGISFQQNRVCFDLQLRRIRNKSGCRNVVKAATYHAVKFDPTNGEGLIVLDL